MIEDRTPTPPIARKEHKETALHGITLTDDYAWLREKESPEVRQYCALQGRAPIQNCIHKR